MFAGYTTLVSKVDALLWVLQLELPNAVCRNGDNPDRQTLLEQYAQQVVSFTSDQGVEFGFGSLPQLAVNPLVSEAASILETRPVQSEALEDEDQQRHVPVMERQVQVLEHQLQPVHECMHLFVNSFQIAGIKHVTDNLLKSVTSHMACWEPLLAQLKGIEKLVSRVQYRERLTAVLMPEGHPDTLLVQSFSAKLGGLRWQVVVDFCIQLLTIQDHLIQYWDLKKFLAGASGHGRCCLAADFTDADSAIRSSIFWGRVGVVSQIALECEFVGRWAGGCPCHEPLLNHEPASDRMICSRAFADDNFKCPRKGCRAAKLACGQGLQVQLRLMTQQCGLVQGHFSRVAGNKCAQDELHADWASARSRLFGYKGELATSLFAFALYHSQCV